MVKETSFSQAISLSLLFGLISFFLFLFLEIIYGDIIKDTLDAEYQLERNFNINLILYLGLIFVFFSAWFINFLTLRKKYLFETIIVSNGFVLIFTIVILFFIAWISIVIKYSNLYQQLDLFGQIKLAPHFYGLFAIYILPNPVYFWILGFIIYHCILIFFIKFIFIRKPKYKKKR